MGGTNRRIYPEANTTAQWWDPSFDRATFTRIDKILLHTTETTGWPGYRAGSAAPTLTYHPRQRAWRQHCYLDRSARALVDPSWTPVRENRDNVIQIEIIAYSDRTLAGTVGGLPVGDLTDAQLGDLADFIRYVRDQWGGPPLVGARLLPYPESYGNSRVRMTSSEYDTFRGVLGHQNASGNTHGDPGTLNLPRILQLAGDAGDDVDTPPTPPSQEEELMTISITNPATKAEASLETAQESQWWYAWQNYELLKRVAAGLNVEVDEAEIAQHLSGLLGPVVTAALGEAAQKVGVALTPEQLDEISSATVAKLGAAVANG